MLDTSHRYTSPSRYIVLHILSNVVVDDNRDLSSTCIHTISNWCSIFLPLKSFFLISPMLKLMPPLLPFNLWSVIGRIVVEIYVQVVKKYSMI